MTKESPNVSEEELLALMADIEAEVAAQAEPQAEPQAESYAANIVVEGPATDAVTTYEEPTPVVVPKRSSVGELVVDAAAFQAETAINPTNLQDCFMQQSSLRAHYGVLAARAEAFAARAKVRFEVTEAALYDEHRRSLAAAGEKTTEKMVENAVKLDSRWHEAKEKQIYAESLASINRALVSSLVDRREMLSLIAADQRDEMKGQLRASEFDGLQKRVLGVVSGLQKAA